MEQEQIEVVGKVFVVVEGMRRCLICDALFTREGAAEHAATPCYPRSKSTCVEGDIGQE